MKDISLRDILTYVSCPLKLKLTKDKVSKLTPGDLYLSCARSGIVEFFNSLALRSSKSSAIDRAVKVFTQVWSRELDRTVEDAKDKISFYNGAMMVTKINEIFTEFEDEVVATRFPLAVPIYNSITIHDEVDILIINTNQYGKKTIRGITLEDIHPWDNDRYFSIKATLFRLAVQSYLGGSSSKRHYSYESRPLIGTSKTQTDTFIELPILFDMCTKVGHAIEKSIIYPTMSKEVCRGCAHKYSCDLSLIKLDNR